MLRPSFCHIQHYFLDLNQIQIDFNPSIFYILLYKMVFDCLTVYQTTVCCFYKLNFYKNTVYPSFAGVFSVERGCVRSTFWQTGNGGYVRLRIRYCLEHWSENLHYTCTSKTIIVTFGFGLYTRQKPKQ